MRNHKLTLKFECFRGTFTTWEELFAEAAGFAAQIAPERLISISHSADQSRGVVTVWYWDEPGSSEG